jgi:hypothetical protein
MSFLSFKRSMLFRVLSCAAALTLISITVGCGKKAEDAADSSSGASSGQPAGKGGSLSTVKGAPVDKDQQDAVAKEAASAGK